MIELALVLFIIVADAWAIVRVVRKDRAERASYRLGSIGEGPLRLPARDVRLMRVTYKYTGRATPHIVIEGAE